MAKCAICEKGAHFGNNVSHSHRRSSKMWKSTLSGLFLCVHKKYTQKKRLPCGRTENASVYSNLLV